VIGRAAYKLNTASIELYTKPSFLYFTDVLGKRGRYECGDQPAAVPREGAVCALVPPHVVRLAQHEARGHGMCLPVTTETQLHLSGNT